MRTLSYGFPLIDLALELTFSQAQLEANTLTASFAKGFSDLSDEVQDASGRAFELARTQALATAKAVQADGALDQLVDRTRSVLLTLSGNSRDTPLYQHLFQNRRPSDVKRLALKKQIERMRAWVSPLASAARPELAALAPVLTAALQAADDAVTAGRTAAQRLTDFTEVGECKTLVDKANALRKATHGKLAELVHKQPEASLPVSFADQFFLQESRWSAPDRDEVAARLARSEQQCARLRQQLKEIDEQRELARKNERDAEAAAVRAELAEAARRRAEVQAREAALKARLDQLTDGPPSTPPPV